MSYHIAASQLTGFCMMGTLVINISMLQLTETITFICTMLIDIFSILRNFEIIFCFLKKEHEYILGNHENKFTRKLISQN